MARALDRGRRRPAVASRPRCKWAKVDIDSSSNTTAAPSQRASTSARLWPTSLHDPAPATSATTTTAQTSAAAAGHRCARRGDMRVATGSRWQLFPSARVRGVTSDITSGSTERASRINRSGEKFPRWRRSRCPASRRRAHRGDAHLDATGPQRIDSPTSRRRAHHGDAHLNAARAAPGPCRARRGAAVPSSDRGAGGRHGWGDRFRGGS